MGISSESMRSIFFKTKIYQESWRKNLTGKNEKPVLNVLESLGFIKDRDFTTQYPLDNRYIADFAFILEKVVIEVDGKEHKEKLKLKKDKIRDRHLRSANWVTIRINESDFFGYKGSFYKNLIKEIISDRREQLQKGNLHDIEFIKFDEQNYDYR